MTADVSPLRRADLQGFVGILGWPETAVTLCNVSVRGEGLDYLRLGDIFQTSECADEGLQEAFDNYGLPELACLFVWTSGFEFEYCEPLATLP